MYPTVNPPPSFTTEGPAGDVLTDAAARIEAEARRTLDVSTRALSMDARGHLVAGSVSLRLEEHGLRTLLQHYTDAFPRATPLFLTLDPGVASAVFRSQLAAMADALPTYVRLRIRGKGAGALFAAVPTSYPPYDVDRVLRDVTDALPDVPDVRAAVTYDAAESSVRVALTWPTSAGPVGAVVTASDAYGGGVKVSAVHVGTGRDLGDPVPGVTRRKRAGTDPDAGALAGGLVDYLRGKLRAVPAWTAYALAR